MSKNIINCNLKIIPISEFQTDTIQKCLIPREIYPQNVFPGSVVKCFDTYNQQFICRIYPMDNHFPRSFCYLDNVVSIKQSQQMQLPQILMKIEAIESEIQEIDSICISITINKTILDIKLIRNFEMLNEIVKDLLENYILVDNSRIVLDEFAISLGLEEILVNSNSLKTFRITATTEINIQNIRINEIENLNHSQLEGLEIQISELNNFIINLQQNKAHKLNCKLSQNALIIGPPGSGKTSICHNFFIENNCNTFLIRSADIIRPHPGETEEVLRTMFKRVKNFIDIFKSKDLTSIFIEDIELICPVVKNNADSVNQTRISNQLISLLDDLHLKLDNVIVLATTSNIDMVNGKVRRPGRFEKEIFLLQLNEQNRKKVLDLLIRNSPFPKDELNYSSLVDYIAEKTPGYVGADLSLLVQNVIQIVLRKNKNFNINLTEIKSVFNDALKMVKPVSIRGTDVSVYKSDLEFRNIGGMTDLKKTLQVSVLAGLKNSEAYKRFGLELPKGILLYGPPGCAKSTIAKCLSNEANMTFISTSGAEVYSPYVGCAEKFISKIFDTARKNAPCLIFFDEIDTLVGKRSANSKSDVQTRILSTLLTEMDGIGVKINSGTTKAQQNNILVLAATNRPDMIDSALMRPGRFDKLIHVPAPDYLSRLEIFKIYQKKMPFNENIDLDKLANITENYSGADLCNLCNEAAIHALTNDFNTIDIKFEDFQYVLYKMKSSLSDQQINWYYDFEKKYIS